MADQTGTAKTTPTATEFAATLLDIDKGRVHDDAGAALAEVVDAVCHTAKKGKLTLVIEVEPMDRETFEDTGALVFRGTVKPDIPRLDRAPSVFFATGVNGQVTRTDPNRGGEL